MPRLLIDACLDGLRTRAALVAENVLLRHQLMLLRERGRVRPRFQRIDRILWAFAARWWTGWQEVLVVVKPATVIGWHRRGFRLMWRWKSRPGRRAIDPKVIALIRTMAVSNPLWGAPRIHGELLKLGIKVAESTVSKYLPPAERHGAGGTGGHWSTFLRNHSKSIKAIDFFVVPTVTFRLLYVFIVLDLERRRILHYNVTEHPYAEWTAQQVVEAFSGDTAPKWLVRDRDSIYGAAYVRRVRNLGIEELLTSYRSPWQNGYVERVIGSIRRELLDHVIVRDEEHLLRLLREYFAYYHEDRTHLGLGKDAPNVREIESPKQGSIVAELRLGGLHHRYRRAA